MAKAKAQKIGLHAARILWLERAYAELRQRLLKAAPPMGEVNLIAGFPHCGARPGPRQVSGVTSDTLFEGVPRSRATAVEIHIREFVEPVGCLAALLHEMVHLSAGLGNGHRRQFQVLAKSLGFVEPFTAPNPSVALKKKLARIASAIAPMPAGFAELDARPARSVWSYQCACSKPQRFQSHQRNPIQADCRKCKSEFRIVKSPAERAQQVLPLGAMDIEGLASSLGVGRRSIWDQVRKGRLPAPGIFVGRRAYWTAEQFDRLDTQASGTHSRRLGRSLCAARSAARQAPAEPTKILLRHFPRVA